MSQLTSFDNFLCGAALSMHAHYLSDNWVQPDASNCQLTVAYITGMGEHALYALYKVSILVPALILNLCLAVQYLFQRTEVNEKRFKIGLLILVDAIPALCIDSLGIICPPLACKVHIYIKDTTIRSFFESWGFCKDSLEKEEFQIGTYWAIV